MYVGSCECYFSVAALVVATVPVLPLLNNFAVYPTAPECYTQEVYSPGKCHLLWRQSPSVSLYCSEWKHLS